MNKQQFLAQLRHRLSGLSRAEIEERLTFYSEMIDDRIDEGMTEEEAVAQISNADAQLTSSKADIPQKKQMTPWEIVFLILGSPIWLSLLIAAAAVILSIYVSIWAVIVSLWATFVALIGSALGCIIVAFAATPPSTIAIIGVALASAGLAIFMFFGCKAATKGVVILTGTLSACMKNSFKKKEAAQ